MKFNVREAGPADLPAWIRMRHQLWPDEEPEAIALEARTMRSWDVPCFAFVAEDANGKLAGFIEVGVRNVAEGCPTGATAYVEGIWVEPDYRKSGAGRQLLKAAEEWAAARRFTYLGSDARLANDTSHKWHRAMGFSEIARLIAYSKRVA